jgi:hypothetical protein
LAEHVTILYSLAWALAAAIAAIARQASKTHRTTATGRLADPLDREDISLLLVLPIEAQGRRIGLPALPCGPESLPLRRWAFRRLAGI